MIPFFQSSRKSPTANDDFPANPTDNALVKLRYGAFVFPTHIQKTLKLVEIYLVYF